MPISWDGRWLRGRRSGICAQIDMLHAGARLYVNPDRLRTVGLGIIRKSDPKFSGKKPPKTD